MRMVSYNILDGGEGRADPLGEVIEAQRPDVVALVEATDLAVVERTARRLKMDYVQAPGPTQASALLSRFVIRESVNHALVRSGISKSLLEATLVDPAGGVWIVGVAHLHAHAKLDDERRRLGEIDVILEVFKPHRDRGTPHLIAGDFNSNSPTQQIDPDRCKPSTRDDWTVNGNRLPSEAVARIQAAGYVDSLHAIDPALADTAGTFSTQFPGQRVDYIFTHGYPRQRLRSAWIERDRLATYASDHYPIGLEIV
jgi:endonuclease/exonuclease/phosphatase family metal-dependent hydrolase